MPEELIAEAYRLLTAALEAELLDRLRKMPPAFFEIVIVDLLIRLGYGGGQPDMGRAIGRSGDGGIDGVIKEDALGLDIVHLQAKRYAEGRTVGRPDVQTFAGSLDGVGATKGIFITTGSFSTGAREYVMHIPKRIVLIDGIQLARMMIDQDVVIVVSESYEIKKIDETYFSEERGTELRLSSVVGPPSAPPVAFADCHAKPDYPTSDARAIVDAAPPLGLRSRRPATARIKLSPRSAARHRTC